ncbi:MAG: hypothetical protein ACTH2X_10265 [Brachybacterium tyrofermentans]
MDPVWERLILLFAGIGAAVVFLPRMVPDAVAWAAAHLLSWRIVVPAADALVRIPTTDVGLDAARLLLGVGALVLAGVLGRSLARSRVQD